MQPLISVIIPYYKGEKYITETLASVFNQGYNNFEIIIVNDGSPIETLEVLQPFSDRVKMIHQENQGQAAARNTGIREAMGEFITFLDQDDLWTDNRIATMLPYLTDSNEYDFVRGTVDHFRILPDGSRESTGPKVWEVLPGVSFYRKSVVDRVGMFNESMHEGEDFDWNIRLHESGAKGIQIPDLVLLYRRHDTNHSNRIDFVKNGEFASIRNKLNRMRNQ